MERTNDRRLLTPLAIETLQPALAAEPILIPARPTATLAAPDRSMVAFAWARRPGVLQLLDLAHGGRVTEVALGEYTASVVRWAWKAPENDWLLITDGYRDEQEESWALRRLYRVDAAAGSATFIAELPHLLPDGRWLNLRSNGLDVASGPQVVGEDGRLYLLAYRGAMSWGEPEAGSVFLWVIDTADGTEVGRVPLPGVEIGPAQPRRPVGAPARFSWPILTRSPEGNLAYVVHGNEMQVTTIDLEALRVVSTRPVEDGESTLARIANALMGLFVGTAHAKPIEMPAAYLGAVVSSDGGRLYLSGTGCAVHVQSDCAAEEVLGLHAVDAGSMQVDFSVPDVAYFRVSPDDRWLIASSLDRDASPGTEASGLRIIDAATGDVTAHLEPGTPFVDLWIDGSSRHAIAQAAGPGLDLVSPMTPCEARCRRVVVVDLARGTYVVQRMLGPGESILVTD